MNEYLELIKQTFQVESECLAEGHLVIDNDQFAKAVELLLHAPRIGTSGCGHSGISATHFAHLLCCIERPARFISPADAVHGAMGFLHEGDVLVLCSRGGKTAELMQMLAIAKERNVSIISITENLESPMAVSSDAVIAMYVNRETDPENNQGTTSFTATSVIFHALQTALIEQSGYRQETFAKIHPGGAVGERLNH